MRASTLAIRLLQPGVATRYFHHGSCVVLKPWVRYSLCGKFFSITRWVSSRS